jgi:ATP-dependent Clp protease adaptor protein ClpS
VDASATPVIVPDRTEAPDEHDEPDRPWNVIVWNDPVTLMSHVVYVLRKLFGYDEPTATTLMLQVHNEGKAAVANGPREKCEFDVHRLHAHGLQATLQRD